MKRNLLVFHFLSIVLALGFFAGCENKSDGSASVAEPLPSSWWKLTGSPMTVKPVTKIKNAKLFKSDGLTVLVPDDWETERSEHPYYVQIMVQRPDDKRNPVVLTINNPSDKVSNSDTVEMVSSMALANLALAGASDMKRHPATWPGWQFARSITGVFDQGKEGVVTDFIHVAALSKGGKVVMVTAQAPRGKLDNALSYQVLRSVKPVK